MLFRVSSAKLTGDGTINNPYTDCLVKPFTFLHKLNMCIPACCFWDVKYIFDEHELAMNISIDFLITF